MEVRKLKGKEVTNGEKVMGRLLTHSPAHKVVNRVGLLGSLDTCLEFETQHAGVVPHPPAKHTHLRFLDTYNYTHKQPHSYASIYNMQWF